MPEDGFDLSLRIGATGGDQTAAEVGKAEQSVERMTAAEFRAAGGAKGLETAAKAAAAGEAQMGAAAAGAAGKLDQQAAAGQRAARSVGQVRAGTFQLGQQVQDLTMQLSMGTSPFTVMAQQTGQLATAVNMMGGRFSGAAAIIGGVWGSVAIAAIATLGNLFFWTNKNSDAQKDAAKATDIHRMSLEDLIEAISAETKALGKAIQSGRDAEIAAMNLADQKREEIKLRRDNAIAALEEAKALQQANLQRATKGTGPSSDIAAMGLAGGDARIAALQGEIGRLQTWFAVTERNSIRARIPLLNRAAEARADPVKGANERFDEAMKTLRIASVRGGMSLDEYTKRLDALIKVRDRELDQAREAEKKGPNLGTRLQTEFGADLFAKAQTFQGKGVGAGRGDIQSLIGFDPNTMAWCAAFLNGLLKSQGAVGTGSNLARSFLAWGSATQDPRKGDVVVSRRGRDESKGHVGLFQGTDARGRILVLGGNTGGKVGTMAVAPQDVLGFRRAPTGAASFAAAQRIEEQRAKDAARLSDFGDNAAHRLSQTATRWGGDPSVVEQAKLALADVDKLLAEIEERKPPNLESLRVEAQEAKAAIIDGINRPFEDFIKSQKESLAVARLISQGRDDEAAALQIINQLEAKGGQLSAEKKAAILASVQAIKAEQREAEKLKAIIDRQVSAIHGMRDAVRGLFSPGGGGLSALPGRMMDAIDQYVGDWAFDKVFGEYFQKLEDQATGANIVQDASEKMRSAIEDTATPALDGFAGALNKATSALNGIPAPGGNDMGEATVTGHREGVVSQGGKRIPSDPAGFFGYVVEELAKGVLGEKASKSIGGVIGRAMQGAAFGNMGAGLIGQKPGLGSSIGGAVGGELGGMLGKSIAGAVGGALGKTLGGLAGPLGSIAGGMLGSALSGLIAGHKTGSATVTGGDSGDISLSGNSGKFKQASSALAKQFQTGLSQIADELDADLGDFAVSIGIRDGKYRVDPSGSGATKKARGAIDFGEDQAGAVAAAMADAIADGAFKNISPAVQKALAKYGADINRAVQEALKVKNLEEYINFFGEEWTQAFRDFEKEAADRFKTAQEYGLDIVKLEKITADARADVFQQVLESRIGSLKSFMDDLNFGALFEGTFTDQRNALVEQIAKANASVAAGDSGAGDRLAELERQLLELSRSTLGTAGPEYASDLAQARASAEAAIELETQRAREAQEQAIAALNAAVTQTQLQNETNDLLVQANNHLARIAGVPVGTPASAELGTARSVSLV